MTKRMLIDGTHPEEVRVVISSANRLDEYDVETSTKRQFKGNIYLAKVTRVEPSLQAAFVDFGGDRHGFLTFNDIHPDYFQIPVEDREALVAAENAEGGNEFVAQALIDEIDSTVEEMSDTDGPDGEEAEAVEDEEAAAIAEGHRRAGSGYRDRGHRCFGGSAGGRRIRRRQTARRRPTPPPAEGTEDAAEAGNGENGSGRESLPPPAPAPPGAQAQ